MKSDVPLGRGGVASAEMHAFRPLVDAVFAAMLAFWISKEMLTRRRRDLRSPPVPASPQRWPHSQKLAVACCAMATVVSSGVGAFQCWRAPEGRLNYGSFPLALTWLMACTASACTNINATSEGCKSWPHVLLFWWLYSSASSLLSLGLYLASWLETGDQPASALLLRVQPELADLLSLPFAITVCLSSMISSCAHKTRQSYLEQPLLGKQAVECNIRRDEVYRYDDAGFWSRLVFQWLNPLFRRGKKERLKLAHIPDIPRSESAELASNLLEESIRKHKTTPYLLPHAIGSAIWKSLAANGMCAGINTLASYLGPLLIRNFVDLLSSNHDGDLTYRHGLILAFIFFVSKTVESLSQRHWYFGTQQIGVRLRAGLTLLIYKKCLSSRSTSLSNGNTVNLINVDVERVGDFCFYMHGIWLLPVHMFLALVVLQRNLGTFPAMATLFSTIVVMVSNTPLAMMQEKFQTRIMEAKDARIKATSEALKSMRIIKLHSWELSFLKKILQLRETERFWLKRYLYTCSTVAFLFWTSPTLVSVATFGSSIVMKTPLTAGTVLSALATFRILQEPIYNLPELISMIAQTKVSIDRINEFLREEDQKMLTNYPTQGETDLVIEIEPAEYAWDSSDPTSKKVSISIGEKVKIMKGQKVAVCGSVGSGKSSLICSMLGEVPRTSGAATKVTGMKAYATQRAWIQTGTVKENILFGKKMDAGLYDSVLDACALKQDIELWSDGDLTVVGERGTNLSGGQKQRIQLARSVYSDSDVYFLDDPFSAVDAHTSTYLFKRCLMGLLSSKTVVYATHQLELLEAADLVIVMKDGSMVQHGEYKELAKSTEGELVRLVNAHRQSIDHMKPTAEEKGAPTGLEKANRIEPFEEKHHRRSTDDKLPHQIEEEETVIGRVKWNVYSVFVMCAYKGALVPVVLLCQVLFQGLQMGSNYWIAWAAGKGSLIGQEKLIGVFAMLSGGSSFFILGRAVLLSTIAIKTAQHLFLGMISAVFRAPLSFFDSTPSSRILSRSSTDQSTVDTDIPYRVAGLVFALIQLLSVIVLMCQVAWQIFPLFLIILAISVWLQAYYITTARELARMVGTRKAPILHHFSETIAGAPVIRCFSREDLFVQRLYSLVDGYSKVVLSSGSTMEWLCVRVNFLFNFVFFVVLVVLVSLPKSSVDPSLAGLIVTYGLNLNVLQGWVIWNMCNVENKMISVERILQFMEVPSEEAISVVKESPPSPEWPQEGKIELEDLHIRYGPSLPIVLKGITCTFPGKKKIGIVGRTGSGKSTLIQALFRVIELLSGRILIDGIDIAKLRLHELRSRLSIIPQDPVLFQGTVRMNLDPLEEHSDREIWEVLHKCNLADTVRRDWRLLDAPVAEDGENWSVGQRQLVCLVRVLLKKRKVLVLDEATASVDTVTDNAIRQAIQEETRECTVLTVAHRIPTVIDNDLVLVLDQGKVVEYESPKALLENKSSSFSALVGEFLLRSSRND
ncbi:hypothetical protein MLD38_008463 [Melastoma candidum]|uniref:Uncharacterized protein n=1 Tax=Melastoma candidum TaxID=119954 RepID=A0ACB9RXG5_9MYRT|nr:hypothetical protein MLD38_008463 [Melastoma candidum]